MELIQTELQFEEIDTLINTADYLIIGNKKAEIKIVNDKDSLNFPNFKVVDKKNNILIIAKNLDETKFKVYEKLNPKYNFDKYQSEIYNGKLAEPDFNSYPEAKRYITRIKEECKNGINFAGKYTLVIWGCGSSCQSGVIVDRINGKIYGDYLSALGSEFRKDSRMIILNSGLIDEETELINFHNMAELSVKLWNGSEFIKAE
ncbi:hypothetical protein [Confluentibacter sediminis]|uniref:hypothetical protein n=1 Tax=Confluentibacter sediminis TaxID=2219045 RepID=UPI0013A6FB70|nr:hypothetical protein [Confluentibacter sediminis]